MYEISSRPGNLNILVGDLFLVSFMAAKFAVASTNYEQLDAMFQLVKDPRSQVFDTHALSQKASQALQQLFVKGVVSLNACVCFRFCFS